MRTPERRKDRGQALMVSAILLLAIITIAFGLAQVGIAPDLQSETEVSHAQEQLTEMQKVQSNIIQTAQSGERKVSTITMGNDYPLKAIFTHPPDPSSQISTFEEYGITLANAEGIDNDVDEFLDGSGIQQSLSSTDLIINPFYFRYDEAPMLRLEHGMLSQRFEGHSESASSAPLINGDTITLYQFNGSMSFTSGRSLVLETVPLSASSETVLVEDQGGPITLEFETEEPLSTWEDVFQSELAKNGGRITNLDVANRDGRPDLLTIELQQGLTYELNMAKIGYQHDGQSEFSADDRPAGEYVVSTTSKKITVTEGQQIPITIKTRDKFHNPVGGAEINAWASEGAIVTNTPHPTSSDGTISIIYEAPEVPGTIIDNPQVQDDVTIYLERGANGAPGSNGPNVDESYMEVEYDITVRNTDTVDGGNGN